MAALIETFVTARPRAAGYDLDWAASMFGLSSLPAMLQTTMAQEQEVADGTFEGLVYGAYLRNSVVFSCLALRARLFSEPRFVFQQLRGGRAGNIYGTPDLAILEQPNPDLRTRGMLARLRLDADLGGHGFVIADGGQADVVRPDWTTMAYGSPRRASELGAWDPQARIIGFGYYPGGPMSGEKVVTYLPEQVAHIVGAYHPLAKNRGVSLLAAALREVMGDNAATTHKLAFFEHAATPNLALKFPPTMKKETALEWIELFEQEHKGALNAFKTMYLGSGVEPVTVGLTFEQMDFTKLQGEAETRIAAATGMHPVVAALSEGLAGSSLNAGNFAQAARLVGDATLRPLWGDMADAFSRLVPPPPGSRLWYDDSQVAFLRSDVKDQADIIQKNAATITGLVKEGFTPESAVDAVTSGDMSRLVHTGMVSVQLQPPGATPAPAAYRVSRDFWAYDEPYAVLGTLAAGTQVAGNHPIVAAFPSMFAPVAAPLRLPPRSGPAPIVSVAEVLNARAELEAAGRPCGAGSIAALLHVSEDTVRRRQAEAREAEAQRPDPMAVAVTALATAVAGRPDQPAPVINVTPAPVTVHTPDVNVTIERGAVEVSAPVTVHPAPVTVTTPDVHIVNADTAAIDSGEIADAIAARMADLTKPTRKRIERDEQGRITAVVEETDDGRHDEDQ